MNNIKAATIVLTALTALTAACAPEATQSAAVSSFSEIGIQNASLHGDIGTVDPVSGPTTYAEGWGFEDAAGVDSVILETTKEDGASMVLVELFDNRIVSDEVHGHTVTAYGEEATARVNEVAGITPEAIETNDVEVIVGEEVYVAECSGPTSGDYDYDEQLDNVIIDVQACTNCSEEGTKIVEVTTWRTGSDKTISGTFEWVPTRK